MAKLIPAGSTLMFEIHYTTDGKAATDRTKVGIIFAKEPPAKRVLTLQMTNDRFEIPAGDPNYRVTVWGSLPNDAEVLSFFHTCICAENRSNLTGSAKMDNRKRCCG